MITSYLEYLSDLNENNHGKYDFFWKCDDTGCQIFLTQSYDFSLIGIRSFIGINYKTSEFAEEIPLQRFGKETPNRVPHEALLDWHLIQLNIVRGKELVYVDVSSVLPTWVFPIFIIVMLWLSCKKKLSSTRISCDSRKLLYHSTSGIWSSTTNISAMVVVLVLSFCLDDLLYSTILPSDIMPTFWIFVSLWMANE